MVYAEKLVTALQFGVVNTRWRDFADVWTLIGPRLARVTTSRSHWPAWRRTGRLTYSRCPLPWTDTRATRKRGGAPGARSHGCPLSRPESFADVLEAVGAFALAPLTGNAGGLSWSVERRCWE